MSERDAYDIEVVVSFTVGEAWSLVNSGKVDVQGAFVVVDCMTNEVRGMGARRALSPRELVSRVAGLREKLRVAGAAAAVICEI